MRPVPASTPLSSSAVMAWKLSSSKSAVSLARGERGSSEVSVEVVVTRFPSGGFDNEHHVVATESERVRDRRTFAQWPGVDGHDVEVNVVVFVVEVQGGRHDVVVHGQQ